MSVSKANRNVQSKDTYSDDAARPPPGILPGLPKSKLA